ncbi:MAG: C39 family peptidase, partial [Patescibacteria group bacterium]
FVLKVPFYVQAPFAVWDELHGEACEEASLHMVRDYYRKTTLDLEGQDQQILNFIHWQQDNGYKVDLTLSQLASAAKKYYQFGGAEILENPTIDEIKREVLAGRPVIVPAAGRLLDNPNFRTPGPIYHMLVIKGFDKTGFITNDPGTRNGEGFHYSYQNLYQSIHNWDPIEITNGAKAVLVYQR